MYCTEDESKGYRNNEHMGNEDFSPVVGYISQ